MNERDCLTSFLFWRLILLVTKYAAKAMRATPPTVEHTMAAMMPPESLLPPESPSGGGMYPVVEQDTLTTCDSGKGRIGQTCKNSTVE